MSSREQRIPWPVLARYTDYLVYVQRLREQGLEWIPSTAVARALRLTSSTVRQDLSYLDLKGISRRGYEAKKLEWALYKELGADRISNVAIVGAGNLGCALAKHGGFARKGFRIMAVFDSDPRVVSRMVGGLEVLSMERLPRVVKDLKIDIGMIAVPEASAQAVADALVIAGVRGLLNLSPAPIRIPDHVATVDVRIISNLQQLLYLMKVRGTGKALRRGRSRPS